MKCSRFIFHVFALLLVIQERALSQELTCLSEKVRWSALTDSVKLNTLLSEQWEYWMKEYPEWSTYVGRSERNDSWTDFSKAAYSRRIKTDECFYKLFQKINKSNLNETELVSFLIALKKNKEIIDGSSFLQRHLPINQMEGIQIDIVDLLEAAPQKNLNDLEDRLRRLDKFPVLIDQIIDLMSEGLQKKVSHVKFLMEKVPAQIEKLTPAKYEDSPIFKSLAELKFNTPAEKNQFLTRAQVTLEKKVYPGLTKLKNFLVQKYIPESREKISLTDLPNGAEWYKHLIRVHTTTNLTAEEIHQIGLEEVNRITQEMESIRQQLQFKGDLAEFKKFLSSDPQFFYSTSKDLLAAYRDIAKRIDPELPKLFSKLPRLTYGVREMADYKAVAAPTAYYIPGNLLAGRPGFFEANTYDLKSRPKWEMEVLTVHEAVPGHHLQISLAQEIENAPEFRKYESHTAFVEGWGLYSESLGGELGLYKDPYSRFGFLSFDMWRAVRLVVDTGMHSKGWSRQKAIDYFMSHVPKTKLQSENEIDRYITIPAQALAYKIGQRKILELKSKAREILKNKFDVREFHNEILKHGSLPLDVLEELTQRWIESKK